ncbi:heterokaryon incompatibility protein-domain-containing protein [Lophiotrema nucula]|uniref:Heterokaryon incompatibility protein-domain-containing protein n=1 Tax=Lophiotrema nucula TaxID=690887 RepID=A0A6A5ZPN6_9PLEO|nr:heterokaryon incompatibility protein-domain-containing protein [Lophiotrema nucula]
MRTTPELLVDPHNSLVPNMNSFESSNVDSPEPSGRSSLRRPRSNSTYSRKQPADLAPNKPRKYDTFKYEDLPRKRGAIRLLKLMPSNPKNPSVECELVTPKEGESPQSGYEALSWCWGTEGHTSYINIRKKDKVYAKDVAPNLFAALKALRYDDKDLREKNHQVEMMYDIYGNADGVCIWLGEANESSHIAIEFVKKEVSQLKNFDKLCESEHASKKWRALLELMQRRWFSRRWVVQEIALARKADIYCGPDTIPWKEFAIAVELFVEVETATHRLSEVMKKYPEYLHVLGWFEYVSALGASLLVDATERLFRDYKEESKELAIEEEQDQMSDTDSDTDSESESAQLKKSKSWRNMSEIKKSRIQPLLSLEYLVSSLAIFDTSIPHDTIYALLAIAKDTTPRAARPDSLKSSDHARDGLELFTQRKRYNVDYEAPYVDVCKDFIQFSIERSLQVDRSRALDVICRPWATEEKTLEKQRTEKENEAKRRQRVEQKSAKRRRRREGDGNEASQRSAKLPFGASKTTMTVENAENHKQGANEVIFKTVNGAFRKSVDLPLPSWVPQLSGAPYGMYTDAGEDGPRMNRKNADPLVGLPSLTHRNYSAAETKKIDMRSLKFRKRTGLKKQSDHYSMYVNGFQLDTIAEVEEVARNGQIPREWADLAGWQDAKGAPPEAFWRTLVADRGRDGKNPPVYYSRACEESFLKGGYAGGAVNTTNLINRERNSIVAQFCRRVQSVIWNRALIKTEEGRLGLVGRGALKGDKVCIMYGCSVPLILRESEEKTDDVYGEEIEWETRFVANTMVKHYRQHLVRKSQHRRRKKLDMARLWMQWTRETHRRHTNLAPPTSSDEEERKKEAGVLVKKALEEFDKWRLSRIVKTFPEATGRRQGRLKYEKLKAEREEKKRQAQENATQTKKIYLEATKEAQQGRDDDGPTRAPIDWWEFDLMLKAGRYWKKRTFERKKKEQKVATIPQQEENSDTTQTFERRKEKGEEGIFQGSTEFPSWRNTEDSLQPLSKLSNASGFILIAPSEINTNGLDPRHIDQMLDVLQADLPLPDEGSGDIGDADATAGAEARDNMDEKIQDPTSQEPNLVVPYGAIAKPLNAPSIDPAEHVACLPWRRPKTGKTEPLIDVEAEKFDKRIRDNLRDRLGEDGHYSYQMLGDCYIHGMMDGEAMLYQNEGWHEPIPSMIFEIR